MVAEQRESGLSQRAFYEQQDLALSTFQWWRRRLKSEGPAASRPEAAPAAKAAGFVEVRLTEPAPGPPNECGNCLEVSFPSGVHLRVPPGWDGQTLLEVLWALEASGSC
jgi:hypothetical protein